MATEKYQLIGTEEAPFSGYNSCTDKTKVNPTKLIRGSYNVFKKRSGNIGNRPGLKRIGSIDATDAGIKSSYEYKDDSGRTLPLRVIDETNDGDADAKLQVRFDSTWYNLLLTSTLVNPALSLTRFDFSSWFDADVSNAVSEFKSRLIMVRGGVREILHWSGGITKVASTLLVSNGVQISSLGSGGGSYVVGDELTLVGGDNNAKVIVTKVSGGVITSATPGGYYLKKRGNGYAAGTLATTGGSGTGATFTVTVSDYYQVTKSTSSESWKKAGFIQNPEYFSLSSGYNKFIVNGIEYSYVGDTSTTTVDILSGDGSVLVADDVVIQSVFVETASDMSIGFACDFCKTLENQLCVGSYTSRIIHISTSTTTEASNVGALGFINFLAITNALVIGDPDFAVLDDTNNGMIVRNGSLYVSSGPSDWWRITPNHTPPTPVPFYNGLSGSDTAYVVTKKEKFSGTGLSGLYAHEFIDITGDNIYYLSKDQQLRVIGTFNSLEGAQFPIVSKDVFEELQEETFTDGHLKAHSDIIYLTAPLTGRHWMYQISGDVDVIGQILGERAWHPPQVSGIARFGAISGVLYGHSNANPVLYQVWDTDQWYDDSPTEADGQLSYNSLARFAYRNHGDRFKLKDFTHVAYEGYLSYGTELYGNVYYEYQGAFGVSDIEINTDNEPAKLFSGSGYVSIGGTPLGSDPLGSGPIAERLSQELLPKFKAEKLASSRPISCTEYCLEVLSNSIGDRWEIVSIGTNVKDSSILPTYLKK